MSTIDLRDPWTWFRSWFPGRSITQEPTKRERELLRAQTMNMESAQNLAAFTAGIRRKSETIGTFPCHLMKPGDKARSYNVRDTEDDLFTLLRLKPHPRYTASRYWTTVIQWLDLSGNAFIEPRFGSGGSVRALEFWPTSQLTGDLIDEDTGEFCYVFNDPSTRGRVVIPESKMIHLRQYSQGARYGRSCVQYGGRSLLLAQSLDQTAKAAFDNGGRPGGYITTGGRTLDPQQRKDAQEYLVDDMAGPHNAGKWKILEGNFEPHPIALNYEDFELLSSRKFSIEEICRLIDIPPMLIHHSVEGQTMFGSGVAETILGWLTFGVRPICVNIEDELTIGLLKPDQIAEGRTIRFNIDQLLRADPIARGQFLADMVADGIYTRNEARAIENLAPKPGGDFLTVQSQNVPLDTLRDLAKSDPAAGPVALPARERRSVPKPATPPPAAPPRKQLERVN